MQTNVAPRHFVSMDLAISLGFLLVGTIVLFQARSWPFRAGLFPLVSGAVLVGFAILKLALDLLPAGRQRAAPARILVDEDEAAEAELIDVFATASRKQWIGALSWMGTFFLMLWLLGALVGIPLFALVYLLTVSRESPLLAGSYAVVSWLFVYGLFDRLLRVPLPRGALLTGLAGLS
jgi:hypothetical protein